ncbi:uncharacterized protein LOC132040878 [Lycium ferocissimum]|uniref:uncharacterized protein LOC132040878 n=1 Tax=Lycium ferocissimum TaxID=112874 RepID=UPI0028167A12|nr:uncharacterized protein LOC132040878 [Lycium ferocissimum]
MDGTGFISLLLWDREATKLIGKSATQLKGQLDETADATDDTEYPLELDTILDKIAPFKVVVKSENIEEHKEVYTVIKISDDADLIKQFRRSLCEDTFTDSDFNSKQVADEDKEITDSNPDNDIITPSNTPAKRSVSEIESSVVEVDDDPSTQLSSNKANRPIEKEKLA